MSSLTSFSVFLSVDFAFWNERITFFAPSYTANSIRKRCLNSSIRSSKTGSRFFSNLSANEEINKKSNNEDNNNGSVVINVGLQYIP